MKFRKMLEEIEVQSSKIEILNKSIGQSSDMSKVGFRPIYFTKLILDKSVRVS